MFYNFNSFSIGNQSYKIMDFLLFIKGGIIIWKQTTQIIDFTEMCLNGFEKKVLFIVFLVLMVYEQIWNGGDFTFSVRRD